MARQLGIEPKDIYLVIEERQGHNSRVVAIDASPNGQHVGNYQTIRDRRKADANWYTIDIDGETVDVLSGTTESAYRAMIKATSSRGLAVPDSLALSQQNDEPWTVTLLTGEALTPDGQILAAAVQNDSVSVFGFRPNRGGRSIRVRPTVVVAELSPSRTDTPKPDTGTPQATVQSHETGAVRDASKVSDSDTLAPTGEPHRWLATDEIARIHSELETRGHALTSFAALAIPQYDETTVELRQDIEATDWFRAALEDSSTSVLMFRGEDSLSIAKRLISPVVAALFASNDAVDGFVVTTINRYEVGAQLKPHHDYLDGTLLITTTTGKRHFHVYEKGEDDVFETIEATYTLTPGSIMLLDGYRDLGHSAECVDGPSISVVVNVPLPISGLAPA